MTINFTMPETYELKPRITVIGIGGAGGNAVNNMIDSNLEGVEFLVLNTDAQSLAHSKAGRKLQMGMGITQGLGAGSRPEIGRAAAEEAIQEVIDHLEGSNMVFITAGLGGGTGTGGAPVIARTAREKGILTVGVVTKPFAFEGTQRMRIAEMGMNELQQYVDTLLVIPNQNLFRVANESTTFADAFKMADDVLQSGVRGVTDLMVMPGLINLDFADIRTVMSEMGKAMMGTGEAEGDQRGLKAAEAAIANPLLDDVTMKGARGVLINITGGFDMTLFEVDEAANRIREEVDPEANIIFGSTFEESLEGRMRVSVVATGIDLDTKIAPKPTRISLVAEHGQPIPTGSAFGSNASAEMIQPTLNVRTETSIQHQSNEAVSAITAEPVAASLDPPFIAPEPEVSAAPRRTEPNPFAAAAMINGSQKPETETRPSLFERMTGTGRAATPQDTAEISVPSSPVPKTKPIASILEEPVVQRTPEKVSSLMAENWPIPAHQGLGNHAPLEPETSEEESQEEDLLEIPAFLRRQAN